MATRHRRPASVPVLPPGRAWNSSVTPGRARYVIRVRSDGTVRVTIPRGGSKREGEDFARRQARWVEKQRERMARENAQRPRGTPPEVERDVLERAKKELPARLLELAAVHGLQRDPRQRAKPAMALGVVLAQRSYLPELAARANAVLRPRLRDDSRADAPEAHGSFAAVLEAGRCRVPGLRGRPGVASSSRPQSTGSAILHPAILQLRADLLRFTPMRVINRTAVTIVGAQPYLDWTRKTEADINRGTLTVARARTYGSAYLLPELDLEEDIQEWVEDNVAWLFEFQLSAWTEDESTWPASRDLEDVPRMVPRRHPQCRHRHRRRRHRG